MSNSELPNWDAASGAAFGWRPDRQEAAQIASDVLDLAVALGAVNFRGYSDWMVTQLTQRFGDVVYANGRPTPGRHYVVPLGDVVPARGSREDRTCDRCRHFVPYSAPDGEFYVLRIALLENVTVCGGLCAACMALEDVRAVSTNE